MKQLIITSEQRVGSRWMHRVFADLLSKEVSPEIGAGRFYDITKVGGVVSEVKSYLKEGKIPKFHGVGAVVLDEFLKKNLEISPYKYLILGIVRNPYDRAVSLAFHNRYHKRATFQQKILDTDREAVIWTATTDDGFKESNTRQLSDLMLPDHSTYSREEDRSFPYIWTTYEWLKASLNQEVLAILSALEVVPPPEELLEDILARHSFKKKSGRKIGEEQRNNLWHRKGINDDYINWFDDSCYEALRRVQYYYNEFKEIETDLKFLSLD